jgi:DNA-binding transcriptional MerR regulator
MSASDADILTRSRILGDADRGLSIGEIAEMLNLQQSSVRSYLTIEKRRIDLYRRLFEQDDAIKERAIRLLESRRSV